MEQCNLAKEKGMNFIQPTEKRKTQKILKKNKDEGTPTIQVLKFLAARGGSKWVTHVSAKYQVLGSIKEKTNTWVIAAVIEGEEYRLRNVS